MLSWAHFSGAAANTLVMTVLARRRELGMLRLVGATRLQVMRMLRWEGVLVGVAGVVLGTAIAAAAVSLGLLAVSLPARAVLRERQS